MEQSLALLQSYSYRDVNLFTSATAIKKYKITFTLGRVEYKTCIAVVTRVLNSFILFAFFRTNYIIFYSLAYRSWYVTIFKVNSF